MITSDLKGDWQSTRDHAVNTNRWLLVNIQDPKEFQCQVNSQDFSSIRIPTLSYRPPFPLMY
jgi:hypothetical protein